ncbi:MAG: hypothetical protein OS112_04215 [Methanoregula sp.]|nr:MAG: hypothetical protein OS112_04215 [Methanoregula sp.]
MVIKGPALKKMFAELAGGETKHREFLQNLLTKDIKAMNIDAKEDFKVGDP